MQTLIPAGPVAYGMLYVAGYDGYMHALDVTTGQEVWKSITRPSIFEMPTVAYPANGAYIADHTVFTSTSIAYESVPLFRGHCLYAYDALTGAQIWNVSGEYAINAVADGVLLAQNNYDGIEYAFSMGPTETTVTAPMTQVASGTQMVIQGTVTDQTPGILQGTPAISDAWMTPWMEYKYMNQPMPTNAQGVPVSIDAIDPNGNFVHLGDATSDSTGNYGYAWAPPSIPGTYKIVATFVGSNSYYSSSGETTAIVVDAPAATVAPVQAVQSNTDIYVIGTGIAIIIAIAIVGLLILRKRP